MARNSIQKRIQKTPNIRPLEVNTCEKKEEGSIIPITKDSKDETTEKQVTVPKKAKKENKIADIVPTEGSNDNNELIK